MRLRSGTCRWCRSPLYDDERCSKCFSTTDIAARELRVGDDLFGYGIVKSAVWVGGSVRINEEYGPTLYADEVVTVRRRAVERTR